MDLTARHPHGPGAGQGTLLRRRVVTGLVVAPRRPPDDDADGPPDPCTDLTARVPGELVARELARHHDTCPRVGGRLVVRAPLAAALRRWYRATAAHERVGAALAGLDGNHHVLHAVPVDDAFGVDHLVVGPGGVVVVRTAHHAGERVRVQARQVRADGRPVGHVREVERQVRQVVAVLGAAAGHVTVRGVVVLVGARSVRTADVPRSVTVLTDDELVGWLSRRPRVISQVVVDRLARKAVDPLTWGAPAGVDDPGRRRHGQECTEAVRAAMGRWSSVRAGTSGLGRKVF